MANYITFVLDETGSMMDVKDEAITGFNSYLETLKKDMKGRTYFSLLLFDSAHKTWRVENEAIKNVPELNEDTYRPGAMTPLWDAVAYAIQEMEKRVKGKKAPDVVITILTDGFENASREFTADAVKTMIEEHKDWVFNFVGAGIDAWAASRDIGIARANTVSIDPQNLGFGTKSIAHQTVSYTAMAAGPAKTRMSQNFYDGAQTLEELAEENASKK